MATVTRRFYGQPDDLSQPARWFHPGDKIEGGLAKSAIAQGNATEKKTKGPAPENKSGAVSRPARASRKKTAKKSGT